jgi:hypothetical protein
MTPETEKEIREILALQREIEDKKAEVSKRLAVIRDREGEDTNMIVIDGELWKITRWGELLGPITAKVPGRQGFWHGVQCWKSRILFRSAGNRREKGPRVAPRAKVNNHSPHELDLNVRQEKTV